MLFFCLLFCQDVQIHPVIARSVATRQSSFFSIIPGLLRPFQGLAMTSENACQDVAPAPEVMDQLCIVTGADKNFFDLLTGLLQSLHDTKHYNKVPVFVIDGGLTPEQKQILMTRYHVKGIKDPGWDVPVAPHTPSHLKCIAVRPYLAKHFPGYRFVLWIDSDTYVQRGQEWGLHRFVNLCVQQGWSMCEELCANPIHLKKSKVLPWRDALWLLFRKSVNAGVFCMDTHTPYARLWSDYMEDVVRQKGFQYMTDQSTATYIYYKYKLRHLTDKENYTTIDNGYPVIHNGLFCNPRTLQPISIMHFAYNKVIKANLDCKIPIRYLDKPLKWHAYVFHILQSQKWHKTVPEKWNKPGYRYMCLRYGATI